MTMDIVILIRAIFGALTIAILTAKAIPSLQTRFFNYGPRTTDAKLHDKPRKSPTEQPNIVARLLDAAASIQVPHRWFTHFYVVSILSSIFWAWQLLSRGTFYTILSSHAPTNHPHSTTTFPQLALTWTLMLLQGSRRLYECLAFTPRSSTSQMWAGHYALGVIFYLTVNIAVWIEAAHTPLPTLLPLTTTRLRLPVPSLSTLIALPLFLLASGAQHDVHRHLARLPRYSIPSHPLFGHTLCPHYAAEVAIYATLAVVAAPAGRALNGSLGAAVVFVAANLGVTADGTRAWYQARFGEEAVSGRWRMLPWVW